MVKIFTMVKGELDIVEDWVLYHGSLFGFKNLYIIDNFSRDGTYQKLLSLKNKFRINVTRLPDYSKKGDYMTLLYKSFCKNELFFPIDIDEFIVYYNKNNNSISCNKNLIYKYLTLLPAKTVYKMNYINSKILNENGYNHATVETNIGSYADYGIVAKSFFHSKFFNGNIDHGNHYPTNDYCLTNLCFVHFHTRNLEQIKKKIYNNVKGLRYEPFNLTNLKNIIRNNPNFPGQHHVIKQIDIIEGKFKLPVEQQQINDINLIPLNNFINNLYKNISNQLF